MNKQLFQKLQSLEAKYTQVWSDICAIESPTDYKQGVDEVGEYFINLAKALGFQVEVFQHEKSGNVVCIDMNGHITAKPICLSAHMDTVFPLGTIKNAPVRFEGNKIFALGAMDCKGGLALAMMVMEALQSVGYDKRPIRFLLQSDEENSSLFSEKKTIGYICEKAKNSAAFINLEGGEVGLACLQRKGVLNFTLTVTGQEAHASFCAIKGANAICEMAHKVIELEKLKDDEGITCNCGVIEGGTVGNTVAGSCKMKINIRFATEEQRKFAIDYVEKIANTTYVKGCTCSVQLDNSRIAMEYTERNVKLLEKMNKIFIANGMSPLKASKRRGGSDAAEITMIGVPTVDNLGPIGEAFHTTEEFAYVDTLLEQAKRVASVIYHFDDVE